MSSLVWEDGVKTIKAWGLQGRGEQTCNGGTSLDGVCALAYARHPITFERLSKNDTDRMNRNNQKVIYCTQVERNSVCY